MTVDPALSIAEKWVRTTLADIRRNDATSLNPAKCPEEEFELYSIPAHESGKPELIKGRDIGSVKKSLSACTVLLSKINPRINRVWVVGKYSGLRQIGSSEWIAFYPIEGLIPQYLAHYLGQERFRAYLASNVSGVGGSLMRVNASVVDRFPFSLPPTREQKRIVESLNSFLTRLDDAVAGLEKVQAKLKSYRAAVLKAAVEGRLVPTEASLARAEKRDYEPAQVLLDRILKERRKRWEETELAKLKAAGRTQKDNNWKAKYEEPAGADPGTLPNVPEGWCWATVDQLAGYGDNTLCDGPFGSNLKTEHYTERGPRVVRLQNIGDGVFNDEEAHISESHFSRLRKHEVLPNDLVVASLGTELPRACVVPEWLGPAIVKADCLRFAVNPQLAEAQYVLNALNSAPTRKRTENLVHGVGRPRIGLSLFRTTAVPLPPRAEQQRITARVEQLVPTSSVIQRSADLSGRRCARLQQAILKWAFEGKLADQDPTDEPAEKLLARIQAERVAGVPAKNGGRRKTQRAA